MNRKPNSNIFSDAELVLLAKKKRSDFGLLYEKYFDQIFRFVFKKLGGMEDTAGDITQLVFMKAMANLDKYEDRGFPFSSWLYRIAQNEVALFFRGEKKNYSVPIDENRITELATEADIGSKMSVEQQEELVEMLNGLEEGQLEIIELRFFQELSFKEIAEIYTITESNAKMRVYRILKKIGKKWKGEK
ncbi:MAG: RNA polymerase sigma factor [Crocinitomicaceae bacterium]